jgi:homoserine kinase
VQADADTLLPLAAELEGHPDNVTAALHGGLTFAAALDGLGKVLAWKARIEPPWKLVVVVPELGMPTRAARAVLPESCSRADAVHNLQRVALLAAQCASGRFAFVPELFDDRLHQPYRTARVPGLDACLKLRHPELFGICLSGSGAAVVAFARAAEHEIARRLVEEFAGHGVAAREFHVQVENRGARVVDDAAARKSRRQSAARVPAGSLGPW